MKLNYDKLVEVVFLPKDNSKTLKVRKNPYSQNVEVKTGLENPFKISEGQHQEYKTIYPNQIFLSEEGKEEVERKEEAKRLRKESMKIFEKQKRDRIDLLQKAGELKLDFSRINNLTDEELEIYVKKHEEAEKEIEDKKNDLQEEKKKVEVENKKENEKAELLEKARENYKKAISQDVPKRFYNDLDWINQKILEKNNS